jgi:membrane protease YdiL (CAAX protease family)
MNEQEPERSTRQPHEVGITLLSAIGLLVLIPFDYTLASYWFFIFFFIFFLWYAIGFPPTTKGDHTCINVKSRYRLSELLEDLSKTKFEIVALIFLVRPLLIIGEYYFTPAEVPWTMDPLMVLVIGPVLEEFYFRGILQERLSWLVADRYAIVLTSLLFAFAHWMPGEPFDIAFLIRLSTGVFFGVVYSKTRNILVSSIAHFGVNLWGFVPLW